MIPAGARFVQFGSFADSAAASRAAGRAMALGYPVLRGIDKNKRHFLMAGPFDSREAIVRALDGLRRAGFRSAYPR
jgi:cell division protein FtsN